MSEDFPSYEELEARLWFVEHQRDRLSAEVAKANALIEEFERKWYFAKDEVEKMKPVYDAAVNVCNHNIGTVTAGLYINELYEAVEIMSKSRGEVDDE